MQKKTVGNLRAGTAVLLALLLAVVLAACNPKQQQPPVVQTGSLQITVQGLTGVDADITVTGPGSYSQAVTATTTLEDLVAGTYTVSASSTSGHVVPGVATKTVEVAAGATATVSVVYVAADPADLGSLKITVEGLVGVDADVTVTGAGFSQGVTGSDTLANLLPGSYTVTAVPVAGYVVSGGATQTVTVTPGAMAEVKVTYLAASAPRGTLAFVVQGLAAGETAKLQVTGPGGFDPLVSGSEPLPDLMPGSYTVTALAIPDHRVVSTPVTVTVVAGETATATVTYLHAGLAVSGDSTVVLPMQTGKSLTFSISRTGQLTGPVTFEFEAVGGLDIQPASGTVAAAANTFTVNVNDDGATLGEHLVVVTVKGAVSGENFEAEHELELSLVPVVTESSDDDTNPTPGSLRGLVEDARTEGAILTFDPTLFDPVSGELVIALTDQLSITHDLTIEGPSDWPVATGPWVRLVGNDSFRIIMVNGNPDVELANLQIEQGRDVTGAGIMVTEGSFLHLRGVHVHDNVAFSVPGQTATGNGGGIWAAGNLTLSGSSIYGNTAANYGGGLFFSGNSTDVTANVSDKSRIGLNGATRGAGVYLGAGTLWIDDSTVATNTASAEGGGIFAVNHGWLFDRSYLNIVNGSEIIGNEAANGGGVFSYAMGRIEESLIEDNHASQNGAGIRNHLYMTIDSSEIIGNEAVGNYGGIFNDGRLIVRDSLVDANTAGGNGGGIYNGGVAGLLAGEQKRLTVERTEIHDNQAVNGGGIFSLRSLEVIDSQIHWNRAVSGDGAGVHAVTIPNPDVVNTFSITGSTMAYNVAGGHGGGIFVGTCGDAACLTPASAAVNTPLTMQNSTIAGNRARWGGGLYLAGDTTGQVRLAFNTIAYNDATSSANNDGQGGGIHSNRNDVPGRPAVQFRGNIIGYNTADMGGNSRDIYPGTNDKLQSLGYNLVSITPHADVQLVALTDIYPNHPFAGFPQIVPLSGLGDNGGYSETLAHVTTGNIIFNYVPSTQCLDAANQPMTVDQRGEPRPVDGRCSVGAVQRQ